MKTTKSIKELLSVAENVNLITDWLTANKDKKRYHLARYVCECLDLRDARGRFRLATTQKALRDLEKQGYWDLPKPTTKPGPKAWNPRRLHVPVEAPEEVPQQAEEIEGLELIEVRTEDDVHLRIWNELMMSEHPLQDARLVGRQLRYLIGSSRSPGRTR